MNVYKICKGAAFVLIALGCILFTFCSSATEHIEYGGDAYTGIQNAAADTANNVIKVGSILVAVSGVVLLCYSGIKAFEYEENQSKHQELLEALRRLDANVTNAEITETDKILLSNGGWKCECGKIHAGYVSSCSCGKAKRDVLASQKKD